MYRCRSRGVSSISYYLACALLHQHRRAEAMPLAAQARREAPGDADVLALSIALGERQFLRELDALHDPITRDLALARASRASVPVAPCPKLRRLEGCTHGPSSLLTSISRPGPGSGVGGDNASVRPGSGRPQHLKGPER